LSFDRTMDRRLLLVARGVRAFGDGFVAILVPVYLSALGIDAFRIGAITTAMLLGSAVMTLAIGFIAHRLRADRLLVGASIQIVLSGIGFAVAQDFWPLLIIAFIGTLNPSASDVSVFVPLEQTALANAVDAERRTSLFASYSVIGSLVGAVGSLLAAAPDVLTNVLSISPNTALRAMFVAYGALGIVAALLYSFLKLPLAAPRDTPVRSSLGPSRSMVYTLAALFSIDSFGGGFYVQSLLALWLFEHFGLSLTAAGSLFFWSGVLSAMSYPAAAWLARRVGLINTMVYTHLPSNVCLILVPFAPRLDIAIGLLLIRSALCQMDVPARTSYVMAVVTPPERPAAAGITAAPRSIAGAVSPIMAGYLLGLSSFGWPLVIGGAINSLYDLALLFMFRSVRPREERPLTSIEVESPRQARTIPRAET
jgi:MFS family permease